jgi:hypothetical protein
MNNNQIRELISAKIAAGEDDSGWIVAALVFEALGVLQQIADELKPNNKGD